ncbi:MAG: hypothetical protein AMXMBFR33_56660 [Candidatus Xenobia bacterium]
MLLFLLALALFRVVPSEMHSAGRSRQDLQAHYACSLGTKHAVKWLSAVVDTSAPNPPDVPGSIGNGAQTQNEPFRMDKAAADRQAYWNPGGDSDSETYTTDGNLARFNGSTGADFDGVSFGAKPYLVVRDDLQVGNWAVRTWIFPDRQTYPIPERFPGLLVNAGQPNGDSTVSLALRYYTIVSEAYPFGDPDNSQPRMRSKVTIGQQSFALYARFVDTWPGTTPYTATLGQKSVDGPFHTNSYFRIRPANNQYFNPGAAWNGVSSFVKMTYAGAPQQGQADIDWPNFSGRDGVAYKGGNFQSYANDFLPWDSGGADKTNAYEKLTGGRANLQGISAINLPTTTSDLQLAAWGFDTPNPVAGAEGGTTGIFIKNNGSSAQGGVYVKGETREAVLGVANNTGVVNFSDTAVTQTGNPALMMQQDQRITATLNPPNYSVTNSNSVVSVSTGQTVYPTNTITTTTPTASFWQTGTNNVATAWSQSVRSSTQILYSVSTQYNYSTQVVAGGGGFGEDVTQTFTQTTYHSTSTGQNVINTTTNVPTGWSQSVYSNFVTAYSSNYSTQYTTQALYSTSTTVTPITNTITSSRYYPTDRVIEVNTTPMNLPVTFSGKVLAQNGVPISAPLNVGTGSVVVIKDSRTNGQQAEVQILAGTLNGVVYSEDNIHNLHGVNKGKRTIATPLGDPGLSTGKNISIGVPVAERENGINYGSFKYPNDASSSSSTNRRRTINSTNGSSSDDDRADLLQWGTTPGTEPTSGGNALGLVSQRVGLNIHREDLNNVYRNNPNVNYSSAGRPPLRIYAVILAGRGGADDDSGNANNQKGGFRIFNLNNTTDMQNLRDGKDTVSGSQYGYFKLFGGLIERRGAANWQVPGGSSNPQGWDVQMAYDEWASKVPPPFFPTTSNFSAQLYMEEYPSATYQTNGQ